VVHGQLKNDNVVCDFGYTGDSCEEKGIQKFLSEYF
jgi:hypothetical protein